MKKLSLLFLPFISAMAWAQFSTPGNGTTYTMQQLHEAAPDVITRDGTIYTVTQDINISQGDTLLFEDSGSMELSKGVLLTVQGTWTGDGAWFIRAADPTQPYKGIRFDETASATVNNKVFEYGGGIQVRTGNFIMDNTAIRFFTKGLVMSSAISFSTGSPVVSNSQFIENQLAAVSSGANQNVALTFTNNYLFRNTQDNSNRPQINMGPSGGGTTRILNNEIIGDRTLTKVGGISVSALLGGRNDVEIRGNIIRDNRYGITVVGGSSTGIIAENILDHNDVEPNPLNGGSGISLSASGIAQMAMRIEKNQFRGNLWGITLIGSVRADLGGGYLNSAGENIFKDNGNGGKTYALFNNTPNDLSAENNCWREDELSDDAMVEEVISHNVDDATLGTVSFRPYLCSKPLATAEANIKKLNLYPNPSNGQFSLIAEKKGTVRVIDFSGKIVYDGSAEKGLNNVQLRVDAGIYLVQYHNGSRTTTTKLIIK